MWESLQCEINLSLCIIELIQERNHMNTENVAKPSLGSQLSLNIIEAIQEIKTLKSGLISLVIITHCISIRPEK